MESPSAAGDRVTAHPVPRRQCGCIQRRVPGAFAGSTPEQRPQLVQPPRLIKQTGDLALEHLEIVLTIDHHAPQGERRVTRTVQPWLGCHRNTESRLANHADISIAEHAGRVSKADDPSSELVLEIMLGPCNLGPGYVVWDKGEGGM